MGRALQKNAKKYIKKNALDGDLRVCSHAERQHFYRDALVCRYQEGFHYMVDNKSPPSKLKLFNLHV